jgi:phosphoglycolate phosphatase
MRRTRRISTLKLGRQLVARRRARAVQSISMLPPSAVVFDLDGTLIDSRGDIVAAVNHALVSSGRSGLSAQVIVRHVGDGARALVARCAKLPEQCEETDDLLQRFLGYYTEHPIEHSRWMPGAQEALEALAEMSIKLAICTNKPRATTDAVLVSLGIRTRFRAVVAGGDVSEKKPAPGPLQLAIKQCGVAADAAVMVGDGPQDVECARRAGARCIAVQSPFNPRERLLDARPDVFLENLVELPEVIRRWRDSTARVSVR